MTTHGKYSASGDEPHYLMVAESLLTDGDLSLENNYAQDDGTLFGHRNLAVELHAVRAPVGELRSVHGLGLPVFVLPPFALARWLAPLVPDDALARFRMDRGLFVYSIVSLYLMALTAVGLLLLSAGLSGVVRAPIAATLVLVVGMSPPVVSHAFLIFPEVVALFLTSCVVWFAFKPPGRRDVPLGIALIACLGLLPWFHEKFIAYSIGLFAILCRARFELVLQQPPAMRAVSVALFLGPQIALLAWQKYEWGTFGGALTAAVITSSSIPFSVATFKAGALGLLIDRQSGLLAHAPFLWLLPASCVLTWQGTSRYLVPFLLLYLPAAAFTIGWWAGFSPAARYLAPSVPLLAVVIAYGLKHPPIRVAGAVLLVFQLAIDAVVWQHPRWLWPATDGNRALRALGLPGRTYERLLPAIREIGSETPTR